MELITPEHVQTYVKSLQEQGLSAATVKNDLSAINTTMRLATGDRWQPIEPSGLGVPKRSYVRQTVPLGIDRALVAQSQSRLDDRGAAIVGLARGLGLRAKECCLLDAKSALRQALTKGEVKIVSGTKGGRVRTIKITNDHQIDALKAAAGVQKKDRSMVPAGMSLKAFRPQLDRIRQAVKEATGGQSLHSLRAAYACARYQDHTKVPAPVIAGSRLVSKALDHDARLKIARELGHGRIDVVASYVGSAR